MQFWQSVFWFSACVGCAALVAVAAAISALACNSDGLSPGEAVGGGVLCGVGLALAVLLFKTIIEFFIKNAVQIFMAMVSFCCIGIFTIVGGAIQHGLEECKRGR